MNYMRFILACFIVILLAIVVLPKSVAANESSQAANVPSGQVNEALLHTAPIRFLPGDPLYFFITIKESYSRFFKPSAAQRAEFDFVLSGKRLKESYLLFEKGAGTRAKSNLTRYEERLKKMTVQVEKARSQNQDIASQVATISDGFKNQETILLSIKQDFLLGEEFEDLVKSFGLAVESIDNLNPGLKNRFEILKNHNEKTDKENLESSPSGESELLLLEASPSYKPRRIIF